MPSPPSRFSESKIRLNRAARRLLWPHPVLYYPVGILRKRGNVFDSCIELHISGYPRSGNTFARTAFVSTNPEVRFSSHRHIPTFVLYALKCGIPGMVLIRKPLDAAVSWAIHENISLEEALAYWTDYHETLLPVCSHLFLVAFSEVTTNFGAVVSAFNARHGTAYVPFHHTVENASRCFQVREDDPRDPMGEVSEMRVSRPSTQRRAVKETHIERMYQSTFLRDELSRAGAIYEKFIQYRVKIGCQPA